MNVEPRVIEELFVGGSLYLPEPVERLAPIFCGCGSPSEAWGWVLDTLAQAALGDWLEAGDGSDWIGLYLLNHLNLLEHGTSAEHSWPTEDGMVLMGFLCRWGTAWDEANPWIAASGISYGQ